MQLFQCVSRSITPELQTKIINETSSYTNAQGHISGASYLKVIINASHVETNATVAHLRDNLLSLPEQMAKVDSDILQFHLFVKEQVAGLSSCGETTYDLIHHLFKGYAAASDNVFKQYILKKKDLFEEGTLISADQLMSYAENKYKIMKQNLTWCAPTKEDQQFIALNAELKALKVQNDKSKLSTPTVKKNKPGFPPKGGNQQKKQGPQNKKPRNAQNAGADKNAAYAWKKIPPTGPQRTKTVDNKVYHWCAAHKAWTIHTAEQCRLAMAPPQQQNQQAPTLELAQAMTAAMMEDQGAFSEE
jgi:hypothetical protein